MKKRRGIITPLIVVFIAICFLNCGDDVADGAAPGAPTNPYPGANAKDVAANTVLAWECTDPDGDELSYDVYLGTDSNPPNVARDISPPYYNPAQNLASNTKYYWRIVAKDGSNATGGPTWSFTTAEASGGGGSGPPKTGYSHFMPLNVGNKWIYEYVASYSGGNPRTGEYELDVIDKFDNYHGFESYLVRIKLSYQAPAVYYITLGCDGDKCYLFTCPWWEYVIEDDMAWMAWSETGLIMYTMLQYNNVKGITVPAGNFENCRQMELIYQSGSYVYTYEESYAEDVGLVYARNRTDYGSDWYLYEYKLKSFEVTPP